MQHQLKTNDAFAGKVKGTIFSKVVKGVRALGPKARERVPEHLRHHLKGRVLATTWHAEADYFELLKVLAAQHRKPGVDVWEWLGRDAARADYEGIYKTVLRKGDPEASLREFQRTWPSRHDTGTVDVTLTAPGQAQVELAGYALAHDEIYRAITGTIWQTVTMAGAQDVEIRRSVAHSAAGDPVCRWRLRWQPQA